MSSVKARKLHSKLVPFIIAPFLWIVGTGVLLWILIAVHDSSWPYRLDQGFFEQTDQAQQLEPALRSPEVDRQKIKRVVFPEVRTQPLQLRMENGEAWFFRSNETQAFAKTKGVALNKAIGVVEDLHRGKFAGLTGRILFSLLALCFIGYVITGILIISARAGRGNARVLHRWLGTIFFLPLLCLLISGAIFNMANELRSVPDFARPPTPIDWLQITNDAKSLMPNSKIALIASLPTAALVEFRNGARIYFSNEKEPFVRKPWTLAGWMEPAYVIHSGRLLGDLGRIFFFVTGLATLALAFAGIWLRYPSRRSRSS